MYTKNYKTMRPLQINNELNVGSYYQVIPKEMTANKNFNVTIERYDREGRVFAHDHGAESDYPNGEQCFFILKGKARVRVDDE